MAGEPRIFEEALHRLGLAARILGIEIRLAALDDWLKILRQLLRLSNAPALRRAVYRTRGRHDDLAAYRDLLRVVDVEQWCEARDFMRQHGKAPPGARRGMKRPAFRNLCRSWPPREDGT